MTRLWTPRRALFVFCLAAGLLIFGSGLWMRGNAALAQILLERAWNAAQTDHDPRPPWPGLDAEPLARMTVPSQGETAIVLNHASGQALAFGPAFMSGSAPFGRPGVSAVAAHKNTHFAFLKDLALGAAIEIETVSGETLVYMVTSTEIFNTDEQTFAVPELAERSELALITCYPFNAVSFGGPLRYIVRAELRQSVMGDITAAETFGPDNGVINGFVSLLNGSL